MARWQGALTGVLALAVPCSQVWSGTAWGTPGTLVDSKGIFFARAVVGSELCTLVLIAIIALWDRRVLVVRQYLNQVSSFLGDARGGLFERPRRSATVEQAVLLSPLLYVLVFEKDQPADLLSELVAQLLLAGFLAHFVGLARSIGALTDALNSHFTVLLAPYCGLRDPATGDIRRGDSTAHFLRSLAILTLVPFFTLTVLTTSYQLVTDPWTLDHYTSVHGVVNIGRFYLMCQACSYTLDQLNQTGVLAGDMLRGGYPELPLEDVEDLVLQTYHDRPEFSVLGLFSLGVDILLPLAGTVLSYIVITLQLD